MIERGNPRRYADIERLNNGLRERARAALLAYLCGMNRVALPFAAGSFAASPNDVSALLLIDVQVGTCQRASRAEEAVTAVQAFVERARLSLEPTFPVSPAFAAAWDKRFSTFRVWQACRRRMLYRENYVEWTEHEKAIRTEAFRFLESELRRATFTAPEPGGMEYWPGSRWPAHPSLTALQHRDPSHLKQVPQPEHLGLMGQPERHARPSWLAPSQERTAGDGRKPGTGSEDGAAANGPAVLARSASSSTPPPNTASPQLPLWIQAAVRLGTRFLRIAAAGEPPATSLFMRLDTAPTVCCAQCGRVHPPVMDEYLLLARGFPLLRPGHSESGRPDPLPGRRLGRRSSGHDVRLASPQQAPAVARVAD